MKNYVDFFPETPEGFHLRVEETLMGLEEKDMNKVKVYSRRMIILAAAVLILIFAATAVAVVQGDELRRKMSASGGEEFAAMIQDVHVADGNADFSFTIDEILWQEEDMYFSYTVTVPDDGNTYLYSIDQMKLGDESLWSGYGLNSSYFVSMFAAGGDFGTEVTDVVHMYMKPELMDVPEKLFEVQCSFMKTDRPIQKLERDAYEALFTEPDLEGNANQMMKNADFLYYTDVSGNGDPAPVIQLHSYPETRSILDAHDGNLTAQDIEDANIAKLVETLKLAIPVQAYEGSEVFFNDVAQRLYSMDGYSIEITKLNIDSFGVEYEAVIRKESGEIKTGEWMGNEPYGQFYTLCKADGSKIGDLNYTMGGGYATTRDGETVYIVDGEMGGIFRMADLNEIYLAPEIYDANGEHMSTDMTRAIKLNPIYNPDLPESSTPEFEVDFAETDDLSS